MPPGLGEGAAGTAWGLLAWALGPAVCPAVSPPCGLQLFWLPVSEPGFPDYGMGPPHLLGGCEKRHRLLEGDAGPRPEHLRLLHNAQGHVPQAWEGLRVALGVPGWPLTSGPEMMNH